MKQFGFLKYPRTYEEHNDEQGGILFADGEYDGIEVAELRIFTNGFLIGTGESTDVAEKVFGQVVNIWQQSGLNLSADMLTVRTYISQLAVKSDIDLLDINRPLSEVLENWFPKQPAGFNGVGVFTNGNPDPPSPVRIERLVGSPLESLEFFAQAPLPTALHLSFLARWETVLREQRRPINR